MSKVISTVHLFGLSIDRRGNIQMSASRGFFEVLRSKLGASKGSTLRTGTFDFCEVRKSQFVGIPDEHGHASAAEAVRLANHILAIYRSILLFERVFDDAKSYQNFVLFNHRAPTSKEMAKMAEDMKVHIPFMALPFKANLLNTPAALAAVITSSPPVKKLFLVKVDKTATPATPIVKSKPKAHLVIGFKRSASPQSVNALIDRFNKPTRVAV